MTVHHRNRTMRRLSVMAEIVQVIDRLNRTQENSGLCSIEEVAGATDPDRLKHLEGLVRQLRGSLMSTGEASQPIVIAICAQVMSWAVALEERDEGRIVA